MTATVIRPPEFPWYDAHGFTFSFALRLGRDVWCSGHSGSALNPDTGRPDITGGMAEQARVAYAKQAAVLAGAGLDLSHVTRVVENVTAAGLPHYAEAADVRRDVFGDHAPVVVTVVVDRLVRRKAFIEIEVHAADEPPSVGGVAVEHGGTVLLPSLLPVDEHGAVLAPDDPAGQYAHCLERAAGLLDGVGLDLSHLVSLTEFTTATAHCRGRELDRVRAELLGSIHPAGTQVLVEAQQFRGVHTSLQAVASRHPVEPVDPLGLAPRLPARSPAVRAGNLLYISGFGLLAEASDLRGQADDLYRTVLRTMEAFGAGPGDLLSTVEYVAADALGRYRDVADVRKALLKEPYPVSTGIVCTAAAHPGSLLDVVAVAAIPEGAA